MLWPGPGSGSGDSRAGCGSIEEFSGGFCSLRFPVCIFGRGASTGASSPGRAVAAVYLLAWPTRLFPVLGAGSARNPSSEVGERGGRGGALLWCGQNCLVSFCWRLDRRRMCVPSRGLFACTMKAQIYPPEGPPSYSETPRFVRPDVPLLSPRFAGMMARIFYRDRRRGRAGPGSGMPSGRGSRRPDGGIQWRRPSPCCPLRLAGCWQ